MTITAFIRLDRAVRWAAPEEARVPAGDRATYLSTEGQS
jgi:hypothetical protein